MLAVPALIGLAFLVVPLAGLVLNAPWSTLPGRLVSAEVGQALTLSLICASLATAVCLLLGVPLAWCWPAVIFPAGAAARAGHGAAPSWGDTSASTPVIPCWSPTIRWTPWCSPTSW